MYHSLLNLAQYSSSYSSPQSGELEAGGVAVLMVSLFVIFIPVFIVWLIATIGMWKMFEKAHKPGWSALVPVYGQMVLAEVAGRPSWWGIGMIISPINLFVSILFSLDIAKKFGKSDTFAIVALVLFPFVGYLMLGFGKDSYNPKAPVTHL